jgi:5'-nucleotidase
MSAGIVLVGRDTGPSRPALEDAVRILVTNDDGVRAPGIAALARAAQGAGHDIVVVAPMIDYSGAGAAVGPVHSREGIDYESHVLDDLDVPAYGIDGPPALAVILACVGGFGPRPDLVLSGINHGINVGRSTMHSGTVGAALTGAHFGLRCLAASIRWGDDPVPWETPAELAGALIPLLEDAPAGTVLNLNVPNVARRALRGVRHGRLGRGGTIRSAVHDSPGHEPGHPHLSLPPAGSGTLRLDLTAPEPSAPGALETDADLVAEDYASLTALVGVREATGPADELVERALARLEPLCGPNGPDRQDGPDRPTGRGGREATAAVGGDRPAGG